MVENMSEPDFEELMKEVHPAAKDEIRSLLSSLSEDWNPFIPDVLRNDSSFTRSGYRIGSTFVSGMLEVVIRVHKVVIGDALGMFTINTYERNGAIHINCAYTSGIPSGFNRWRDIGGEQKGNPIVIDSSRVEYQKPSNGESHSDQEVEEIVGNVTERIRSLAEQYSDVTQEDIMEYYEG